MQCDKAFRRDAAVGSGVSPKPHYSENFRWSRTTKQASNSSAVQGGGKWRSVISSHRLILPGQHFGSFSKLVVQLRDPEHGRLNRLVLHASAQPTQANDRGPRLGTAAGARGVSFR